jgi:hypothetical protein
VSAVVAIWQSSVSDGIDCDVRSIGRVDESRDVGSIRRDDRHRLAVAALFSDGDDLRVDR